MDGKQVSRWFRHYAGMMRDEKLVRVAVKSKQSVERVVWVWGAILESAAEINDGGRYEFDAGEAAYFLRCDESDVGIIVSGLSDLGRLVQGVVAKWSDRQFDSDTSRERQRRYRERVKAGSDVQRGSGDAGNTQGDVTPPSRDGQVTLQETETDTYQKEDASASSKKRTVPDPEFEEWYGHYPHKVQRGAAEKAFAGARRIATLDELLKGLFRYKATKPDDVQWRNPATWLNGKGWLDEPAGPAIRNPNRPTGPPQPRNAGELARMEILNGTYHDPPSPENRRVDPGNGVREAGGTGLARRFALPANVLGRVG